jgi:hypothetical protein
MKKLLVPIVVLALVAIAIPVMAETTVAYSGELEFGYITNFSDTPTGVFNNQKVVLKLMPDKINTVTLDMRSNFGTANAIAAIDPAYLHANEFSITSDVGMALGIDAMGVDPVLKAGWFNATSLENSLGYGFEEMDYETGTQGVVAVNTAIMKMVNVNVAFAPTSFNAPGTMLLDINGTVGPVTAEIAYVTGSGTSGGITETTGDLSKGVLGVTLSGSYDVSSIKLSADGGLSYNLDSNAVTGNKMTFGVGVEANYNSMASLAVSYQGMDGTAFNKLGVSVGLTPISTAGVDVGVAYDAGGSTNLSSPGTGILNSIDGSVWTMFGAAKLRVGYVYMDTTKVSAPWTLNEHTKAGDGLYFDLDLPF